MTFYQVAFTRAAEKAYRKLPKKDRDRVQDVLDDLEHEPRPVGCKKLKGSDLYRVRVGDYRIVYGIKVDKLVIAVVRIGHRREVYRGLT